MLACVHWFMPYANIRVNSGATRRLRPYQSRAISADMENRYQLMVSGSITSRTIFSATGNRPHMSTVSSENPRPSFQFVVKVTSYR